MQDPTREPNLPEVPTDGKASPTAFRAPSKAVKSVSADSEDTAYVRDLNDASAGLAEHPEDTAEDAVTDDARGSVSRKTDDVDQILKELREKRTQRSGSPVVAASDDSDEAAQCSESARTSAAEIVSVFTPDNDDSVPSAADTSAAAEQIVGVQRKTGAASAARPKKRKKKQPKSPFLRFLKRFIPWRGDSILESVRKIVFFTALTVAGVCGFLIFNYYSMLYKSQREYEEIQKLLAESLSSRGFSELSSLTSDPESGEILEYFEYNDIANLLLKQNSDLVGYITIDGTEVSYPVVQRKSPDPIHVNTNDYYLYRSFDGQDNRAGCIFMDFRCHFDEVVDHRRAAANSGNLVIYGHNMNNRSMFGSLKDYIRNYSFYKQHPMVHLQSLYKSYDYKIFAMFVVDAMDTTSEFAYDCWNTLDFKSEEQFYEFVNGAKKRTIIANDVDVKYGDPILTLYTCSGMVSNGKLIIMARMLREGEDPAEGTQNSGYNKNALYPKSYYNNHKMNYDPEQFVPFGSDTAG